MSMYPEEAFEYKFKNCMSDALIKTGTGLVIGTIASLFFVKRAAWPMCAGAFFGFGASTRFCENDLNKVINASCLNKKEEQPAPAEPDEPKEPPKEVEPEKAKK